MNYIDQWKTISLRINGLMRAGKLHAYFLSVNSSDPSGTHKRLQTQCQRLMKVIIEFQAAYKDALPKQAQFTINEFIKDTKDLVFQSSSGGSIRAKHVQATLVMFGAFETELSFILTDGQIGMRVRSERAFEHLQRSIVVDKEFRKKWEAAFAKGEVACEKLGSVHLLIHGIWAFKANAEGGRTDLVFQEAIKDLSKGQRYAEGIVLTEWKVARKSEEAELKFKEARTQAKAYAHGVLGGSELSGYRYAVVVSNNQVAVPNDLTIGNVVWRHINIAVEPIVPSRASKKR